MDALSKERALVADRIDAVDVRPPTGDPSFAGRHEVPPKVVSRRMAEREGGKKEERRHSKEEKRMVGRGGR
jgi:hypothetical protein